MNEACIASVELAASGRRHLGVDWTTPVFSGASLSRHLYEILGLMGGGALLDIDYDEEYMALLLWAKAGRAPSLLVFLCHLAILGSFVSQKSPSVGIGCTFAYQFSRFRVLLRAFLSLSIKSRLDTNAHA